MQVINQQIDGQPADGIPKVSFASQDYWTDRLSARLKGRYLVQNTTDRTLSARQRLAHLR